MMNGDFAPEMEKEKAEIWKAESRNPCASVSIRGSISLRLCVFALKPFRVVRAFRGSTLRLGVFALKKSRVHCNCPLALPPPLQIIVDMKKETVSRFSVSLPPSLLRQLDEMSGEKGYDNSSLTIADR